MKPGCLALAATLLLVAAAAHAQPTLPCAAWSQETPVSMPSVRRHFGMAFDAARQRTIVFGGERDGPGNELGDTWTFDGASWSQVGVPGPSQRSAPAMAYDPVRQRVVLFGGTAVPTGTGNREFYGDTWEWDGNSWQQVAASGPPARSGAGMAYDAARGRIVLAGGIVFNGGWVSRSDCWEWDGQQWTEAPALPHAVAYAPMCYDAARQRLVIFSGTSGQMNNSTLERSSTAWFVASSGGPAPRANHMMAYAPALGGVVVYGGTGGNPDGEVDDTWLWNGTVWQELAPAASPSRRAEGGMVLNSDTGRLMLVMGWLNNTNTYLSEQWELSAGVVAITEQPQSLSLVPSMTATFHVGVSGTTDGFQWRKDGSPIANGWRVSGADTATLTISGVQSGDQGSYDCVVTSACGSLTSDAATLSCAPIVLSQPGEFALLEPGTQLAVSVPVNAAYSYRWRQNGQNLFNFPGVIGGVTTRTLSLLAADPSLEGTYDLVITSPCGTVTTSPTLVSICDIVDFNHDGLYPDTTDIDDFLSVFSGGFCSNDPHCGDVDFNNDGLYPDTADIDALLSVFSGGPCLP